MRTRLVASLTLVLVTSIGCRTPQRSDSLGRNGQPGTTSVLGHWILATPADSTAFVGASHVELVLSSGSFALTASYPNRAPLAVSGRVEVGAGGMLTFVPAMETSDARAIGVAAGKPVTRIATASGSTLVLALPGSRLPTPSSVWYRLDAARIAGLAR
jgi:hypothetical protein